MNFEVFVSSVLRGCQIGMLKLVLIMVTKRRYLGKELFSISLGMDSDQGGDNGQVWFICVY